MMLSNYRHILQSRLSLADTRWEYTVAGLPNSNECNRAGYMKSCDLTANASKQEIVLTFSKIPPNRAISQRQLSDFVHVTCAGFCIQTEDDKPSSFRDSSDYIARFLKCGLVINGVKYSFYGHSNSQLKSKSCFLMAGSQEEVDHEVESLGDFSTMKSVAKKTKRIGLLFSNAHVVVNVDPGRCKDIEDIERDGYIFTDGCGKIGKGLAKLLVQKRPIVFRNKRYHPSVFQIRYRGYKGVVTIEPQLPPSLWLELRGSMRKFAGGDDHSFAIVEYSKLYTYGYLNDETVLLLHALGISLETLDKKQNEYIDFLEAAGKDPRLAFRFFTSLSHLDLAEKCLLEGIETVQKRLHKLIAQERGKMLNKRNEHKCRILVPRSRLLFGVCDPYGMLQEGQCYVKPTSDEDGIPYALKGSYVLVARNPCLHPGDLQKLWVVDEPRLRHLVDCIVFPTKGKRPSADMMSGGDLDGDTFFVCWDSDLIPGEISQPAEYPGAREPIRFSAITTHDRIDYFARSSSMQLGRIKNLYLRWARVKGPLSSQCQELNRLFSQCVDASKIKIPDKLSCPPLQSEMQKPFILDVLHERAEMRLKQCNAPALVSNISPEDLLLGVLSEPGSMSQFELAQLTLYWCQSRHANFADYWQYFDPTKFSTEERVWFLSLLPPQRGLTESITNDMMHSTLLSHSELDSVGLRDARVRWRCVFDSYSGRLSNLFDVMYNTFPFFTRKMLVLTIHERLSVALYLPKTIDAMDDFPLQGFGRLFAFPHDKHAMTASRINVPTKHNTHFYYDHNKFELFEGQRGNTFIKYFRGPNDETNYRNIEGRGSKARAREKTIEQGINYEFRTSIALNKFSQGLATHIGRLRREGVAGAELYVVSNTDTRSLHNIDLWLEQVDTGKVHQNFVSDDNEPPRMFDLTSVEWENESESVIRIVRQRNFDEVEGTSSDDVARALELAWLSHSHDVASEVYRHVVEHLRENREARSAPDLLVRLLNYLFRMPALVIYFIRMCPWTGLEPAIYDQLLGSVHILLDALILSANKMGRLTAVYLKTILSEIKELTMSEVARYVEEVALVVASPETGLDILLEGLDPMTSCLLLDTPRNSQYLLNQLTGIAIDHICEASENVRSFKTKDYEWRLDRQCQWKDGILTLKADYRLDAPMTIRLVRSDHVRFVCYKPPANVLLAGPASFEALVEKAELGQVTFRCLRHPPPWYQQCVWSLENCGSFTTTRTMMDAVLKLVVEKEDCCKVFRSLFSSQCNIKTPIPLFQPKFDLTDLNKSQRNAVIQSLTGPVTCIWGPPGTGKTHTIVSIICEILASDTDTRLLVTAFTHNAVDHVMRQYMKNGSRCGAMANVNALRVSTDLYKVSADIRAHTCDAMLGKDINQNPSVRRKAENQIKSSRLVFTTCIGAGLGLLRNEKFENVIIDEASQQTEPGSLVPLVKGASRVVLIGDHVQLRATVQPDAQALGFDISLFERLWTEPKQDGLVRKVMLDTQYRMHPSLCAFPSREFYESKLQTTTHCENIALPGSAFPWPSNGSRMVFIPVSTPEDLGRKSKSNTGQAQMCRPIIEQLRSPGSATRSPQPCPQLPGHSQPQTTTLAILTPYTRQADLLRRLLPSEKVSSIDGFQGQEADVIVYVTVRCNLTRDLGFLKDMRRLNVAMTRAKAGVIVVGDRDTLTGRDAVDRWNGEGEGEDVDREDRDRDGEKCFAVWKRMIDAMTVVEVNADLVSDVEVNPDGETRRK